MEHKTWHTMDAEKAEWGPGPWMSEPDKEQWPDEATGYPCLIKRNRLGALCGYVGVPEGHPWHGESPDADVHGGVTYGGMCQEGPEGETVCHVPAPGEPEPLYWVGFDCAHAGDISPGLEDELSRFGPRPRGPFGESYKPVTYVKAECASLAAQAAAAAQATASA